jgi:hypothetical protein
MRGRGERARESRRIFAGSVRFRNFGVRQKTTIEILVPPGELRVQIYEGDTALAERHFTTVASRNDKIRIAPHS